MTEIALKPTSGGYTKQLRVLVPTIAGLTIAAGLWLNIVYSMRVKELQYRLRNNSDQKESVRTLSLVSRYQLLRQKAGERDTTQNYGREGRLMQALQHTAAAENSDTLSPGETTALWTIEFFNVLAASPRFKYEQTTQEFKELERAFYFELRRNYAAAVERYDWVLKNGKNLSAEWYSYTKLHRAFCHALSNGRSEARADLEDVIRKNNNGEYRLTAQALLSMVAEIDNELVKVEFMVPSADKGAAYYKLTAYDKAIQTFKGLSNITANPSALFYLGRSHEESGNNTQAAEHYRKIIALHARTDWAVKANRRLFAMGAFYTAGSEYRRESKSNVENKIVNDVSLLTESKRYERVAVHIEKLERGKNPELSASATPLAIAVAKADVNPIKLSPPVKKQFPLTTPEILQSMPAIPADKKAEAPVTAAIPFSPPTISDATLKKPAQAPAETPSSPMAAGVPTEPAAAAPSAIELAKTWEQKEALSRKDKGIYLRTQKILHRVTMEDGNQFTGVLMKETPAEIFLFTVMGKIAIDKAQVSAHEKVRP